MAAEKAVTDPLQQLRRGLLWPEQARARQYDAKAKAITEPQKSTRLAKSFASYNVHGEGRPIYLDLP